MRIGDGVKLRKDDLKKSRLVSIYYSLALLNFVLRRLIRVSTVSYKMFYLNLNKNINTTMQPLVQKWTGLTYKSGKLDTLANLIVLRRLIMVSTVSYKRFY